MVVSSRVEVLMTRRLVDAEIKADPSYIIPLRRATIDTPDGGYKELPPTPTSLLPQEVLIAPAKRRLSDMMVNTELGDLPKYPYIVVARHNANFQRDDIFTWRGDDYQVMAVHEKPGCSFTLQVDYYGGDHNG